MVAPYTISLTFLQTEATMAEKTKEIDVYREWLGIKDAEPPLSHYQLLRLEPFEDDTAKIRKHYRKLNAHVRQYQTGAYAKQSQDLLNELARAMLCLTDQKRKNEYDASLGRKKESKKVTGQSFEETLLARGILTNEQLGKAQKYANAVGVELRDAIIQQKFAKSDDVVLAYAESVGLPYIDWADVEVDEFLIPKVPAMIARQNTLAPVMIDDDLLIIASPNLIKPEVEDDLRLRMNLPVRTALCTTASIREVIDKYYPQEKVQQELAAAGSGKAAGGAEGKSRGGGSQKVLSDEEKAAQNKQRLGISFVAATAVYLVVMTLLGWSSSINMVYGILSAGLVFGIAYAAQTFLDL